VDWKGYFYAQQNFIFMKNTFTPNKLRSLTGLSTAQHSTAQHS
jgi:hypothetical protein